MHRLARPVIWLLCAYMLDWGACGAIAGDPPDAAEVVAAGRATALRLQRAPHAWTSGLEFPNGELGIEVVGAPEMRKLTLWADEVNGSRPVVLRIIVRDGWWYVTTAGQHMKTRAYAAPLGNPKYYEWISRTDLLVADYPLLNGELAELKDGKATYYSPLAPELREHLNGVVKSGREVQATNPEGLNARVRKLLGEAEQVLEKGTRLVVDVESGVVEEYGVIGNRTWCRDFRWLEDADESLFRIDDVEWVDRTANLIEECESPDDLLVIWNCPYWRPGRDSPAFEPLIVDRKSREQRRIPFELGSNLDACLSRDRRHAYVVGILHHEGGIALFEIDLRNGSHRRLGGSDLQFGVKLFPTVSPDGRTLAVLQRDLQVGPMHGRIHLVDIASGESRPSSPAMDMNYLSWLPEGDGLIVMTGERNDALELERSTICRIALDAEVRELRPGSSPIVLHADSRILFKGRADRWHTCDFKGGDLRLFGDGLKGFDEPSVAPDGKQLLMLKVGDPRGPVPHLVEVETGKASPLPLGRGLWAMPRWR